MAKKKGEAYGGDGANDRDFDEEPDFEDPPGFVDDIPDEELLADLLEKKPCETDGVENVVIIDNIPKVGPTRLDKLNTIIRKIFGACGQIVNVVYPKDEEENTKGYAFLEYKDSNSAEKAVKMLNNHRLDKAHTFLVNLFVDVWTKVEPDWEPPQPQPYKVANDLYNFMLEPDAHDQFCVVAETMPNSVQVQLWQNAQPEPNELLNRDKFTENFIKWSPLGTYIVTFHKQGVVLWGGPNFSKVNKFPHAGTQIVDFSPCEQYLVTYGPSPTGQKIMIWDIRSGVEKRSFVSDGSTEISMFRWSKDDKYVASMGEGVIHVYETPSFYLLDMKSIKVQGIKSFSWSPSDNIIAYWVAEETDVPAKVVLMDIPRKNEIRTKNLFNVADCNIHWQKSGDYLCVKVDRYQKCKKDTKKDTDVKYFGIFHNFEIFHMREKDIPVDSVEIKEAIHAFSWEPVGHKFAIIHGEANSASVSFYETKKEPTLIKKLEKKVCTHLFWSPRGQFIVLANLQIGSFEFVDSNDFITMNSGDHYRASDVEWDPTGRFVTTGVSSYKVKEDHGYYLWSFQGRIVKRVMLKNFIQFAWRPRPPTLLGEAQQKEIKKNLKKYYAQFESKDRMRMTRASKEILEKRAKLREQFMEYRNKRISEWESQRTRRMQLRNNTNTDHLEADSKNVEEEIVEFLVKEETTLLE